MLKVKRCGCDYTFDYNRIGDVHFIPFLSHSFSEFGFESLKAHQKALFLQTWSCGDGVFLLSVKSGGFGCPGVTGG